MNNFKQFISENTSTEPPKPQTLEFPFDYKKLEAQKIIKRILNLKKLSQQEGGFCVWQPKIKQFALQSPDHMAIALIFPIATQLKNWGEVNKHFIDLVTHLRDRGSLQFSKREYPFVKWKGLSFTGREGIEYVWENRQSIYNILKPMMEQDDSFEIYKFLATQVPKLGIAKAGFAVQLLIGKLGCVDSVNTKFLNIPPELLTKSGKLKSSVKGFIDKKSGELKEKGIQLLKAYEYFLQTLQRYKGDDESRQLWDIWCSIIGIRTVMAGEKHSRFDFDAGSYSGEIPMYKFSPSIIDLKDRLIKAVREKGGKLEYFPDGRVKTMDYRAIQIMSNIISQDHYQLMLNAMKIPAKEVKDLNKQYLEKNKHPELFESFVKNGSEKEKILQKLQAYLLKILNFGVK